MTIAEVCIFASVMLYLLPIVPVKWGNAKQFDNARPRNPAFYQEGIRARAFGAHQNGIEAYPFFAAAVLLAEFRSAPQNLVNELSVLFVIVRAAYVLTYVGDRPSLRSILWTLGILLATDIFYLPMIRNLLPI